MIPSRPISQAVKRTGARDPDQREFELDHRAAEAAFAAVEADFKRYKELETQKLASRAEFEQRKARYVQAKVDLEKAKLTIDRSVIRAPFDGIVVDRTARVGQKVLIDDTTPLFKVSAMQPLLARIYLTSASRPRDRHGRRRTRASPARSASGR